MPLVLEFRTPYIVELRPVAEFSYETAKNKLARIHSLAEEERTAFIVPGSTVSYDNAESRCDAGYTDHQGKLLRLAGCVDMESRLSVGCAGAVISHLARRRAVECLPGDSSSSSALRISTVESFSLQHAMYAPLLRLSSSNAGLLTSRPRFINADALASLQIMQSESHPHSHNQGPMAGSSGSKEGLSVYGLFHHLARTPQGKLLLRQYFLRPSTDYNTITERLDTASVLLKPENQGVFTRITQSLGQIKNIRAVITSLKRGIRTGLSKGGGTKNGTWSTLRLVRLSCHQNWVSVIFRVVRVSCNANPRGYHRARRRGTGYHQSQGKHL